MVFTKTAIQWARYCSLTVLATTATACLTAAKAPDALSEKEYYKLMYEQASKSAADASELNHWALGIVATVFSIIVVIQLLFSFKINKDELRAIEARVNTNRIAAQNEFEQILRDAIRGETEQRSQFLEGQLRDTINREVDRIPAVIADNLRATSIQIEKIKQDLFQYKMEVRRRIFKDLANDVRPFKEFISSFDEINEENKETLDKNWFSNGPILLNDLTEVDQPLFERIKTLYKYYEEVETFSRAPKAMWIFGVKKLKVYRFENDAEGKQKKVYVENDFTYEPTGLE